MFKNIKNRMWLLNITQHELASGMMRTDHATLNRVMSHFEKDMRAREQWPFNDPETMALMFSGWLGKQDLKKLGLTA